MVRVVADQALFTPVFLAVYFLYHGLTEGLSRPSLKAKFDQSYLPALLANYKLWPLVQAINFWVIPLNFRLIFVNVVALGWSAYLSHLNAKYVHKSVV